ncbi:MAG: flavodoxin domain-containing protein [Propioniciclava sp.]
MRVLVVAGGRSGATMSLAEAIGEQFTIAGHRAAVAPARAAPAPGRFDAAVLGGCLHFGLWNAELKRWIDRQARSLRRIPFAAFTVGLPQMHMGGPRSATRAASAVLEPNALTPVALAAFDGWWYPDKVADGDRQLVAESGTRQPEGDYRDLDAVAAWAQVVVPLLSGPGAQSAGRVEGAQTG